eukprot:3077362-Amphidinium_carterae.2
MVKVGFKRSQALVINVYFQSGFTKQDLESREKMQDDLLQELACHRAIPIMVGGDWNDQDLDHPLTSMLTAQK